MIMMLLAMKKRIMMMMLVMMMNRCHLMWLQIIFRQVCASYLRIMERSFSCIFGRIFPDSS